MPRTPGILSLLACSLLTFANTAQAARQDGLAVYLNFDESDKREGDDNSGPLRNLVANSDIRVEAKGESLQLTTTEGRFGKAAVFTNKPSAGRINNWAVSLGKLESLYAGSFTVAYWVKASDQQNAVHFSNQEFGNAFAPGVLMAGSGGKGFRLAGTAGSIAEAGSPGIADGKWHHVALTVDRAAAIATFYVDGKSLLSKPLGDADTKLDNGASTYIGAGADEKNAANMSVDDFGLWTRALSTREIEAMGAGNGRRIPEPSTYAAAGAAGLLAAWAAKRRRRSK